MKATAAAPKREAAKSTSAAPKKAVVEVNKSTATASKAKPKSAPKNAAPKRTAPNKKRKANSDSECD
jgi:hypothetical protein